MAWNPYARRTDGTYSEPSTIHGHWVGDNYTRTEAEGHAAHFDVPICHNDHGDNDYFHDCNDTAKPCPVAAYLREHQP